MKESLYVDTFLFILLENVYSVGEISSNKNVIYLDVNVLKIVIQ